MKIEIPYKPRNWAKAFHASFQRFAALILHRRAGKTTCIVNHHQRAATNNAWETAFRLVGRSRVMAFHVPGLARGGPMTHPALHGDRTDGNNGAFDVESPEPGWRLACVASDGDGWQHVSVHAYNTIRTKQRVPTWKEMSYIKRLFWDGDDVVMQLHPREDEYVNCHPFVLHLWRPTAAPIPTPPAEMVGPLARP